MVHTYESEILHQLMERDGFNIPSSVPPYESEIKAYLINQVKLAYPKLTDYEAEWLLYNYTKHIPAEFPISSVSNVTQATFENVVPYAYKSAILKGNTLVNLCKSKQTFTINNTISNQTISTSKTYTLIIDKTQTNQLNINFHYTDGTIANDYKAINNGIIGEKKILINFSIADTSKTVDNICVYYAGSFAGTATTLTEKLMLIEGDYTNINIPYFEGMQSVKMPVLTTSNEDGTKTNILTVNGDVTLRGIGDVEDTLDCLTGELTQRIGEMVIDGDETWHRYGVDDNQLTQAFYMNLPTSSNKNFISNALTNVRNVNDNIDYECFGIYNNYLQLRISKSKLSSNDISGLKTYLQTNPVTIQYELATESIKTVDLNTVNENGETVYFMPIEGTMNATSSSETIQPTFDMSVPVEATTQNLASFIDMRDNHE